MRRLTRSPLSGLHPALVASGLVFALAGLMFVAAANTSQGTDLRAERATELRDLVRQNSTRIEVLESRVADQRQRVDDLAAGRSGDPAVAVARRGVAGLAPAAGMTEVTGAALSVTLDDAPLREPDDPLWSAISADDVIVHQADVQAVVNALWSGGAEALQVMDQRIVATSSIQCVGNTLLLQGRVYSPPFTITAIGPRKKMRAALRADPGVAAYRSWAGVVGLGYQVESSADRTIPAYTGPIAMSYASTTGPAVPAASTQPPQ